MTDAIRKAIEDSREREKARAIPPKRPTIAELEAILAGPMGDTVFLQPDGSVFIGPEWELRFRDALEAAVEALEEIYMTGISRPAECGEGDEGDGHWTGIAKRCMSNAARAKTRIASILEGRKP